MKAGEQKLTKFLQFQDAIFVIPVYQRNYEWTETQCKQLFYDILKVANAKEDSASHFIGSIVYLHDDVFHNASVKSHTIIDGQQRLTTISLLLMALHHQAKATKPKLAEKILNQYLVNQYIDEKDYIKLHPTQNHFAVYTQLLEHGLAERFEIPSRLVENFRFFYDNINIENLETVLNGVNRLIFVDIALERGKDDPQRIFESLNSTGLDLSQGDLIRNYVLMELPRKKQEKLYNRYWLPIEEFTTDKAKNKPNLSDFIRDFMIFKTRKIPNKNGIYEAFKKEYPLQDTNIEELLGELKKYAQHYSHIITPKNELDKHIARQLFYINHLEMTVSYPFLLGVYEDYASKRIDKNTFIRVLELVQSYVWRRFIIGLPTNALNNVFLTLYKEVDYTMYYEQFATELIKKTGTQRFPANSEVIVELETKDMYNIKPKNRSYFLERLETFNNKEATSIFENDDITIEHIFPQNPHREWKEKLSQRDFEDFQTKYVHTIGNLTLSGYNNKLSNKYFTFKRDDEKGFGESNLYLNRFLKTQNAWTIDIFMERFELLAQRFLNIWTYPEIEIVEEERNTEENIFDIEDPTGKKLDYILWDDEKIEIIKFKTLYHHVVKCLFEEDKTKFFTTNLADKLSILEQKPKKGGFQINEKYWLEDWLSGKNIFKRIKLTLEIFEKENFLYVKFKPEKAEE